MVYRGVTKVLSLTFIKLIVITLCHTSLKFKVSYTIGFLFRGQNNYSSFSNVSQFMVFIFVVAACTAGKGR